MKTMLALVALIAGVAAAGPVYDIPRLHNVVIDGKTDDWVDEGFRVETLAGVEGKVRSPADLDSRYTVYPDAGHGIWDTVYRTDEFYTWLLQQVRRQPAQPRGIEKK